MQNESVGFVLLGLKTEQFATFEDNFSGSKKVNLTTAVEFKINSNDKQIGVYTSFTFEQTKKAFLKIKVSCHFAISPDSWEKYQNDKNITFPMNFMRHLTVITVGSARGVLHCKTEGTEFNKYVLPTINVNELVEADVELELK